MRSDFQLVSIVIPIHNESDILIDTIESLFRELDLQFDYLPYEIILFENGSTDDTAAIAENLASLHPTIRVEHQVKASYGSALRRGIEISRGDIIIVFNADLWDVEFLNRSIPLLEEFDLVLGSKNLKGARDHRPLLRRLITVSFNFLLRVLFGFRGTDTHGVKAMRGKSAKKLAHQCVTEAEIFDTELVLRGQRLGMRIKEIPVSVEELRPSRYSLWRRIPKTLTDLVILIKILGIRNRSS